MKKEDLIPGIPDRVSGYDKITGVQICLKGKNEKDEDRVRKGAESDV